MVFSPEAHALLYRMAAKYIWWKSPGDACVRPERVIAQVMTLGEFDDAQQVAEVFGEAVLRDVLCRADAGVFDERSWEYWHYRLGLAEFGRVPAMPTRNVA